jgi:O-antigen/teichoic acid export membrane protein
MTSRKHTALIGMFFQWYAVAVALVSGIVLVPLYLRYIPGDLYGAWQASGNILTWITLVDPGISLVLQQRIAASFGRDDKAGVANWAAVGIWVTAGISILILVAGWVLSYRLGALMNLPPDVPLDVLGTAFRWSAIGSAVMVLSFSFTGVSHGLQRVTVPGWIYVAASLTRLVLVVVLLRSGYGLLAIALPTLVMGLMLLIGNAANVVVAFRNVRVPLTTVPSRIEGFSGLLSYSFLGRLASIVANNIDLVIIARFIGPEAVNVFRFTRTAPEISRMFVERPVAAVQPSLAHLVGSGDREKARAVLLRLLQYCGWLLPLVAAGMLIFNGPFITLWIGPQFFGGALVNALLVAGATAAIAATAMSGLSFAAGDIRRNSVAGALQAVVYVGLLWLGSRTFGLVGVAAASVLSVVLTQAWYLPRVLRRLYDLRGADLRRLKFNIGAAVAAGIIVMVAFWQVAPQGWRGFSIGIVSFAVSYGTLLYVFSSEARAEVGSTWRGLRLRLSRG